MCIETGVHLFIRKVPVCWAFSTLFNDLRLYSGVCITVVEPFYHFPDEQFNDRSVPCASFNYSSKRIESRDYYYCKFFSDSFWVERLNMNWFMPLDDARDKIKRWLRYCNEFRPHSADIYMTLI